MSSRRQFLQTLLAGSAITLAPGLAIAGSQLGPQRLVVLILRGGLDGLAAVAPYADRNYQSARGGLALAEPGDTQGVLDLDGFFGLHPALTHLHKLYQRGECVPVHAIASPYRKRSHFDAQNVLELGLSSPNASKQGWLNRALALLANQDSETAIAIGQNIPLVLRGPESVSSWTPSVLPAADNEDLLIRLQDLYQQDEFLGPQLEMALNTQAMAEDMNAKRGKRQKLSNLAGAAGRLLANAQGPKIAVLEANGWDTHANQGTNKGRLAQNLKQLDAAIKTLADSLGRAWQHTAVLVVTEFGRTVAMNGTRGSDHGTASAAFLVGGAVKGGRVLADWPGLSSQDLYQGRDLQATLDIRSVYKSVLAEHFRVDIAALDEQVFLRSNDARIVKGLFKI